MKPCFRGIIAKQKNNFNELLTKCNWLTVFRRISTNTDYTEHILDKVCSFHLVWIISVV
jgi:hypothetical protein